MIEKLGKISWKSTTVKIVVENCNCVENYDCREKL